MAAGLLHGRDDGTELVRTGPLPGRHRAARPPHIVR